MSKHISHYEQVSQWDIQIVYQIFSLFGGKFQFATFYLLVYALLQTHFISGSPQWHYNKTKHIANKYMIHKAMKCTEKQLY